ncbi:hypothetical protein [Paraburkholderia nemoris]|uniref:hypothetical protein n=1 Tax=Paraburkholderia nemoris TaxID=2793076 RepID=UPI001B29635A|nr:hypothetical protein [Paraburkholderia nemoris]CAE6732852.1 hypothetical protein R75777_02150 [Paraburkholderia nemoris]
MKNTDERSGPAYSKRKSQAQLKQIAESLAIAGEITLVYQYANPDSGLYRYFIAHCIGGRKYLLPLGLGAGVAVLYCHEESETGRIATRRELISERDPCETTRKRARENIRHYSLRRKDRIERSLLTREGQHALWSDLEDTEAVFIDSLEGFTKVAGKDAAGVSAAAPLSELLEKMTDRGIAVLIFARAPGRNKKEPPAWLDGLACNMVYVEEDRKNPMQGGARLTFYRDAINERDRALRRYTWWWTVDEDGRLDCSCREEHFVEPPSIKQQAHQNRFKTILVLIAEGITQQKEIAKRLGVNASTIFHDTEELARRGEIIKDPKTGALSLPTPEAPLPKVTDDTGDHGGSTEEPW